MNFLLLPPIALSTVLAFVPLGTAELTLVDNRLPAAGTFHQSAIHTLQPKVAGKVTILEQTSSGTVTGTIDGTFTDVVRVAIKPNGNFNAKFTLTCTCTVDGRSGVLTLSATDSGKIVSPTTARMSGRAVIIDATGGLAGTTGSLAIHGVVDVTTGLATYAYSGFLN